MRIPHPSSYRFPVEFLLLLAVAVALPLSEGMKNYLLGLYAITWYVNRLRHGFSWASLGGRWDGWDTLFAALLVAAPVGAALAGLHHHEWTSCLDVVRMVSVAWFLKRSGYRDLEWIVLHVTLQVAIVVAALWALVVLAQPHAYEGIQLNSVGHVNQSVIYIVIAFGALVGGTAAYWRVLARWQRTTAVAAMAILLAALFAAGSRAGAATAIACAAAFGLMWRRRSPGPVVWTAVAIAVFAMAIATFDTDMRRKQEFALDSPHPILNERYPIWQQALTAWRAHPVFGVGADNFGDITAARVAAWDAAAGSAGERRDFVRSSHAHNLYLNTLAERGAFGLVLLAMLCGAWAWSLARGKPDVDAPPVAWLAWSGAAAALAVALGLGAFNTTLHDEHGMLALMMLGIWLGYSRERTPAPPEASVRGTRPRAPEH